MKSILTVPALAVSVFAVNSSCPLGSAASASAPRRPPRDGGRGGRRRGRRGEAAAAASSRRRRSRTAMRSCWTRRRPPGPVTSAVAPAARRGIFGICCLLVDSLVRADGTGTGRGPTRQSKTPAGRYSFPRHQRSWAHRRLGRLVRDGPQMVDIDRGVRRHVHAAARRHDRQRRAAGHPDVAEGQLQRPAMGRRRLRADAGGAPADHRLAGRPVRAPARVHDRPGRSSASARCSPAWPRRRCG